MYLQDLENYILELIPTLPQLKCLEESFYSFYVCTAVRKFFFFLDPMRTGEGVCVSVRECVCEHVCTSECASECEGLCV